MRNRRTGEVSLFCYLYYSVAITLSFHHHYQKEVLSRLIPESRQYFLAVLEFLFKAFHIVFRILHAFYPYIHPDKRLNRKNITYLFWSELIRKENRDGYLNTPFLPGEQVVKSFYLTFPFFLIRVSMLNGFWEPYLFLRSFVWTTVVILYQAGTILSYPSDADFLYASCGVGRVK